MNEILDISDNINNTKIADDISKMPGQSCFMGHPVLKH